MRGTKSGNQGSKWHNHPHADSFTHIPKHDTIAKKPGLAVYGADARIPEINYVCKDHEEFKLGSLEITPLHTPCHTKGHVCYYVVDPATNEKAVFTGEYVTWKEWKWKAKRKRIGVVLWCMHAFVNSLRIALFSLPELENSLKVMHGTCIEFSFTLSQNFLMTPGFIVDMNIPETISRYLYLCWHVYCISVLLTW